MNNKLIMALSEKRMENLYSDLDMIFDVINLYGKGNVAGVEIGAFSFDVLKKCANLAKKNKMLFRCHYPYNIFKEAEVRKYLNCIDEIAKTLRYKVNVVFHSDIEGDTMEEKIEATIENMSKITKYINKYNLDVTVSLENLNYRHEVKRINMDKIDNVLSECEDIYFTYDVGHDFFDNKKVSELSQLQKERINNVHIHSVVENKDHNPIKKTTKELEELRKAVNNLKELDYQGPIVLEYGTNFLDGERIEEVIINFVKLFIEFNEMFE